MIIIKLGGTNGSGKTSIARCLIELTQAKPVYSVGRAIGYRGAVEGQRWSILGDYAPRCGGLDVVPGHERKVERLERFMDMGDDVVFFESYITGVSYKAFGAMSEATMRTRPWLYAFLDTPIETCIKRVALRQDKDPATYTPPKTLVNGHRRMQQAAKDAMKAGHNVLWLNHKEPPLELAGFIMHEVDQMKGRM